MAADQSRTIVVIGDRQHADFRETTAWLMAQGVAHFPAGAEAIASLRQSPAPRWIFLLAAHRGAYDQATVEQLHRLAPLARLIVVCGSWCEGESRSGKSLSGLQRVYWHQFPARAQAAIAGNDYAGWSLPRTATPIDVSLHANRQSWPPGSAVIAIIADLRADALALADGLRTCGATPLKCETEDLPASAAAVLWNGRSWDHSSEAALVSLTGRLVNRPVMALLDFPRANEVAAATRCGVAAVLSKPFLLGKLRAELLRLGLTAPAPSARQAG